MRKILELVHKHKRGVRCGIYSVCSAHPLVIEATLRHAMRKAMPIVLIEATCNQVNQFGGYTGMSPAAFRDFVWAIADQVGYPRHQILLGGDHLGPNPWTSLSSDEAMQRSDDLIREYVEAGFRKIHLDCSMPCKGDTTPLSECVIAARAARLCKVAEETQSRVGSELCVYVIGTEVPVPGGAAEELHFIEVTKSEAIESTIDIHNKEFVLLGLQDAWNRVIAIVAQPGVEFDHSRVVPYDPAAAISLSKSIEQWDHLVFEAHSTDYQSPNALKNLVRDHFAILKVGPGVTFALREALWALDALEQEWIDPASASQFRAKAIAAMKEHPQYWQNYYNSADHYLELNLQYSLSDRIRYYWPLEGLQEAQLRLFDNLRSSPPPDFLVSQYLPIAYSAVRRGTATIEPKQLVLAHIEAVLEQYYGACVPDVG